ncbi:MAG: hypothetical protein CW341_02660 [Bacteroidetes bacterium]|nr:hypothetical protein [Bacteroidota bacterium]
MTKNGLIIIFFMGVCISICGQKQYCQEFIVPHYTKLSDTCLINEINDSTIVVSGLFKEIGIKECTFLKQKDCIVLSINGQQGVFFGSKECGTWILGDELTKFTIQWDSLYCFGYSDMIYEFELVPFYTEHNPYIEESGICISLESNDNIKYLWTMKDGVIAIRGDFMYIRKDWLSLKECLY